MSEDAAEPERSRWWWLRPRNWWVVLTVLPMSNRRGSHWGAGGNIGGGSGGGGDGGAGGCGGGGGGDGG